ncbi:GRAP1 protein, partial [Atractosteus spatula]|nr:GRAP1 protein [Atractosteus spatula]
QEVDALLSENEMLQGKLHSQEDDFRLQNSTLMQELSKLCTQIEQLEQENQQLREGQGVEPAATGSACSPVDGELLRLQAENSALQKKMAALLQHREQEEQSQAGAEVNGLRPAALNSGTPERVPNERIEQAEAKCAKLEQRVKELGAGSVHIGVHMLELCCTESGWPTSPNAVLTEVELQLHTEQEEKRLLKAQLQTLESSKQADLTKLQEDLAKLSDKLKKKQESFMRLQAEKEALYNDSRIKISEIQQKKEEELKSMNIRNQKLQGDLQVANQTISELKEQLQSQQKEHEAALLALRDQVACQSAVSQEQVESILTENDALRTNLAALEQIQTAKTQEMNVLRDQNVALTVELQQRQAEQESFLAQRDDLNSQLQEASRASSRLLEQLTQLGQDKERLQQELEETRKTADKRKAMLDEMAIETAQEKSRHKEDLGNVRLQHEKEVLGIRAKYERELRELHEDKHRAEEEIRSQLRDERVRPSGLHQSARAPSLAFRSARMWQRCQQTRLFAQLSWDCSGELWRERDVRASGAELKIRESTQRHSCVKTRKRRNNLMQLQAGTATDCCCSVCVQETIEKNSLEHQEQIQKLKSEEAGQLQAKDAEIQGVKQQLLEVEKERDEHVSSIAKLKQEIKDTVDGQRILEKKGSSALKDLKRQLHLERKRADKLQERLQEILTNTKTRTGLEELVLSEISSPSRTQTGDSSSVSSFSYREIMKEGSASQSANKSNTSSPQAQRPAELSDDEISELFQRLAEVQQEKWMLEEKVKHLEVSCSSMADDICRKSAIIETYVMDSRRGPSRKLLPSGQFALSSRVASDSDPQSSVLSGQLRQIQSFGVPVQSSLTGPGSSVASLDTASLLHERGLKVVWSCSAAHCDLDILLAHTVGQAVCPSQSIGPLAAWRLLAAQTAATVASRFPFPVPSSLFSSCGFWSPSSGTVDDRNMRGRVRGRTEGRDGGKRGRAEPGGEVGGRSKRGIEGKNRMGGEVLGLFLEVRRDGGAPGAGGCPESPSCCLFFCAFSLSSPQDLEVLSQEIVRLSKEASPVLGQDPKTID